MRVAVLGLGFMGSTHLKAMRSSAHAELVAVYSSDERKLAGDLSAVHGNLGGPGERLDFGGVTPYRDIDELLADDRVEAVDLCLPTHLHAPVAIAALRRGKHVLVEKPMALDRQSADAMIAEGAKAGRVLMTAQVLRFFPMYEALRDAVRSGRLGEVRWAALHRQCEAPSWSEWLRDPIRSGGGVFDLLIHDADMALHLFGRPEAVYATGNGDPAAGSDDISANLRYTRDFNVTITGGWRPGIPFSMDYKVIGDSGSIEYSSDRKVKRLPVPEKDGYAAEIEYFIECCRNNREPVLCPARESADAVALMRLLLEARTKNGEWIPCQL